MSEKTRISNRKKYNDNIFDILTGAPVSLPADEYGQPAFADVEEYKAFIFSQVIPEWVEIAQHAIEHGGISADEMERRLKERFRG